MKEIKIPEKEAGQRLDKFLLKYFNEAPKSFVYKMLRKKRIKHNGAKAAGSEIINEGDILTFYLAEETMGGLMSEKKLTPAKRSLDIAYEDENILIVNKPSGLICHPDKDKKTDTLIDRLLLYLNEKGEYIPSAENAFTPALCNRLDTNTGGLVILGKSLRAAKSVNLAIKNNGIKKFYIAVAVGSVKSGTYTGYIIKDEKNNKSTVSKTKLKGAKEIITRITTIKDTGELSLLNIELTTGRSHQIRAQLSVLGHPLLGDKKYGGLTNKAFCDAYGLKEQFLFAEKMVFYEKDGLLSYLYGKEVKAKLPGVFLRILQDYFKEEVK